MENQDEDMEIFKKYISSKNDKYFNTLYNKHKLNLSRYFYNRGYRNETVEDLCQDTWYFILRYSERISAGDYPFYPAIWFHAKTAISQLFRKPRVETVFIEGMEFACKNLTPFENVSEEGNLFLLKKHLQSVLRINVDAHFLSTKHTHDEIAEITNCCRNTVKNQKSRLIKDLKLLMLTA